MFDFAEWASASLEGFKARGREATSRCPFCGRLGRFSINLDSGAWICNRQEKCGRRGRGLSGKVALVAHVSGLSGAEARAMVVGGEYDPAPPRKETTASLRERLAALRGGGPAPEVATSAALPAEFVPVWDGSRWRHPVYLRDRGVRRETARAWGMGFCDSGRYAGRVVIPFSCPAGSSFTARATGSQEPRYLNPIDVDHGRLLIGWNVSLVEDDGCDLVVCEGPLDAVALWQMGHRVLALGGNRVRDPQLSLFCSLSPRRVVYVMLDPTETTGAHAVAAALRVRFGDVRVATLEGEGPGGAKLDPGCASPEQVSRALSGASPGAGRGGISARVAAAVGS